MIRRPIIKIPFIALIAIAGIFTISSLIAIALSKQGIPEHIQEGITAAAHGGYMEGGYPRSRIQLGASSAYFMTDGQFEDSEASIQMQCRLRSGGGGSGLLVPER